MPVLQQVPSIILPRVAPLGTELETVADLLEHTSLELDTSGAFAYLQEKVIYVIATEIVVAGVPGPLWLWVELSPYLTTTSAAYWAAIGGGGGALAPTAPTIVAPTGVNLTSHTLIIPWSIHSNFARLVVQTPVAAAPATAFWSCQCMVAGK